MKRPAIMIAAPKSGSGKTTITCSLIKALLNRGLRVKAFKCGPDYIDPLFHREVLGIPSENLDLFFVDKEYVGELAHRDNTSDISVIEGVMGLYDGIAGISEEASSYALAEALDIPIILVIDAKGMGRSILAPILGMLALDRGKRIQGLILNRVSEYYYKELKGLIENETTLPVLGFMPDNKLGIESRYLGLTLPSEIEGLKDNLSEVARLLEENVDIEAIIRLAKRSVNTEAREKSESPCESGGDIEETTSQLLSGQITNHPPTPANKVRIAYALDEAFCFYYEENLRLLKEAGAELISFSPIHDKCLPNNIDGILLAGGYPELHAKELSENESMKASLKKALNSSIPSLAECGGFMYLHNEIVAEDGISYPMLGVIPGKCSYKGRLVRFGYAEFTDKTGLFLDKEKNSIRGHEFHYYDSDNNGEDGEAIKPVSGRKWSLGHIKANYFWSFAHLYYGSNKDFVKHFIDACNEYKIRRD